MCTRQRGAQDIKDLLHWRALDRLELMQLSRCEAVIVTIHAAGESPVHDGPQLFHLPRRAQRDRAEHAFDGVAVSLPDANERLSDLIPPVVDLDPVDDVQPRRARRRGRKGEQPSGWLDVNRLEVQIAVRRGETLGMHPAQGHDQVMAVMLFLIEHASCDGMLRLGEEAPLGTRRSPSKRSTRVTTSVPFGNGTVSGSRWTSPLMQRPGVPQFCPCTLENTFCRDWWPLSHAETGVYRGGRRRIGEISLHPAHKGLSISKFRSRCSDLTFRRTPADTASVTCKSSNTFAPSPADLEAGPQDNQISPCSPRSRRASLRWAPWILVAFFLRPQLSLSALSQGSKDKAEWPSLAEEEQKWSVPGLHAGLLYREEHT